jgi:hypothetical protein
MKIQIPPNLLKFSTKKIKLTKCETHPLNNHYLFHYKTPKLQNQTQFHQMTNKYNFLKSQTNLNMYISYIHTTNFNRKKL